MVRRLVMLGAVATFLAACDDGMERQPGYPDPGGAVVADFDPILPGTVPRGRLEWALAGAGPPASLDLRRGRTEFEIHCAPCHGLDGYGDGMVVRHGFPPPPSFHEPEQRQLAMARIVEVITNGQGDMFPYADRVAPRDRWAIAAYIKALQLSQAVPFDRLPPEDRQRMPPP